jgi:hypothetical protein
MKPRILFRNLYVKNSYQSFHPRTEFVSYKVKGSPYTAGVREECAQRAGTEGQKWHGEGETCMMSVRVCTVSELLRR